MSIGISIGLAPRALRVPSHTERALAVQPSHLLGMWPLNETSGTTAVNAQGTAARNGAYKGAGEPLLASGEFEGQPAPSFDGTNDYCNIHSASLASAFNGAEGTISAWAKVSGAGVWTDATFRRIFTFQADASNRIIAYRDTTNNTLAFLYAAGGTVETALITTSTTGWFHFALTWSKAAEQVKAYFNGAQSGPTLTALGVWSGSLAAANTMIGALSTAAQFWSGLITNVAVWDTPLTAAEIASL
jgi:hypothetical protein